MAAFLASWKLKCITQLDQQKHRISCLLTKANPWSTPALFFRFSACVCVVITGHSRQSRLMSGSTDLHPWNQKLRFSAQQALRIEITFRQTGQIIPPLQTFLTPNDNNCKSDRFQHRCKSTLSTKASNQMLIACINIADRPEKEK